MDWTEHEFLVAVFIGNGDSVRRRARDLKRKTGIRPHIFAESFTFWQRLLYNCHTVKLTRRDFLLQSLIRFATELEKYDFPVIVMCDDFSSDFVRACGEDIECYYLAVNY